ncbi:MAG: hypothetical protein WC330_02400 [Candidatus Omnitrophota bacterium]|jgi:hypothetical protein
MKFKPIKTTPKKTEIIVLASITLAFFLSFYKILFSSQHIFSHDAINWYGLYHMFCDSLANGIFPYWDPYDSCGQPFYYSLGMLKLYEPITLWFLFLGKLFHISFLTLYHWEYITRIWLVGLGIYLCYRQINKYFISNILVFGTFLFSVFTINSFRQNGILNIFFWTPWIMLFFLRLLKDFKLYNIVGFSLFLGLSLSSYLSVYILTYLFIFALTLLVNDRVNLANIFKKDNIFFKLFIGIVIVCALAVPLFAVYIEQGKIVPILRIINADVVIQNGINLKYNSINMGGSQSSIADFFELVFPGLAKGYFLGWFDSSDWVKISECFLYIGIIPLLLAILGIFRGKEKSRINFLITLLAIGLLMLGPKGGLHHLLYFLFYPLRLARHMHLFSTFFVFSLLYFVGQGADYILERLSTNNKP